MRHDEYVYQRTTSWMMQQQTLERGFTCACNGGTVDLFRQFHVNVDDFRDVIRGQDLALEVNEQMLQAVGHQITIGDFDENRQLPRIDVGADCAAIDVLEIKDEAGDAVVVDAGLVALSFLHAGREERLAQ